MEVQGTELQGTGLQGPQEARRLGAERPPSGPASGRVDLAAALRAVERGRTHLLSLQHEDGHWCGQLEGDSRLESEYLLLLVYLGRGGEPRCQRLARRLRALQQPEGGWALHPGGPAEVSASVKGYFALKLVGDAPSAPHMERARRTILALGGLEAVSATTRILLALLGQLPWSTCPALPPELVLLPGGLSLNLYALSAWSRALLVPLSVLWAHQPVRAPPPERAIPELSTGRVPPPAPPAGGGAWERAWRTFFHGLDRGLLQVERLGGFTLSRKKALAEAERWMLARLERSDGLGALFPSIVASIFALDALGYPADGPLVRQQLHELERLEVEDGEALRVQPCRMPVGDTALSLNALVLAGESPDSPALQRAARWLLEREVRSPGDWRVRNARGQVGGWSFGYANEFYPDLDDTAQVLTSLSRLSFADRRDAERAKAARARGLAWVLSMQNPDGGFAAFDRQCNRRLLTCVPFASPHALLDESCPDITGRLLETLSRERLPASHPAVRRAVRSLYATQEEDGSWSGRWGCNHLYGTWLALWGLRASGEDLRQERLQRAARWLRARQNPDGGWGESYRSYEDARARGVGESSAAQTAWALLGLLACGDRTSESVRRGVAWLVRAQGEDGTWHDGAWTGTGAPRVLSMRRASFDDAYPLLALGALLRESPAEPARTGQRPRNTLAGARDSLP